MGQTCLFGASIQLGQEVWPPHPVLSEPVSLSNSGILSLTLVEPEASGLAVLRLQPASDPRGGPSGGRFPVSRLAYKLPAVLMPRPLALQVRTKDVLFESISHLIDYHLQNGQPIVAAESELHLRGVVKREP